MDFQAIFASSEHVEIVGHLIHNWVSKAFNTVAQT